MALAVLLRNASKVNGASFIKSMRAVSLSANSTPTNAHMTKPTLGRAVAPLSRNISISAPKLSAAGGSHSAMWTAEKAVSAGLLAIIPAAFIIPSQALDALMAVSVVIHQHWGLEAIIVDYLRPIVVGNVLPKVAHIALYLISVATLGGLFYFIYNDIGIANSIKKLWTIKGQ